jgi:hypothetical protein
MMGTVPLIRDFITINIAKVQKSIIMQKDHWNEGHSGHG